MSRNLSKECQAIAFDICMIHSLITILKFAIEYNELESKNSLYLTYLVEIIEIKLKQSYEQLDIFSNKLL